ncbi:RNA polymerase sigma factor [Streptomyces murinus]|uniref:RNA polymerase sigma factor n=1 Tax=Streptomyces murinus TaxID=33900 RepID=UPI00382561BD
MTEQQNGSVVNLAAVYADHRAEMTGLARRLLAEERVPESVLGAEDVVQSAFTKALRTPENIREPRAYLYAVIRNDVRVAGRQVCARMEAFASGAEHERAHGEMHVADFSDLIANRMAVYKALDRLPPQQRTAVWATKALDYTQAETAEFMGKAPGTIATHVLRAVAAIRATLVAVLTAIATGLVLAVGRIWQVVPAAGSDKEHEPPGLPTDRPMYLTGSALLVTVLAVWGFRAWSRRRSAFEDSGTFARRPVIKQIRAGLKQWWWDATAGGSSPRRRVRHDTPGYTRTRLPLPDEQWGNESATSFGPVGTDSQYQEE